MTTTLAITPAEWASVQDGVLWLVREGEVLVSTQRMTPTSNLPGTYDAPPDEFVQAAAPCETCGDERAVFCPDCGERGPRECVGDGKPHVDCPDCRIELVAICDTCDGQGGYMYGGSWGGCEPRPVGRAERYPWEVVGAQVVGQTRACCHVCHSPGVTVVGVVWPHASGITHLGWGYAIGQPLPIVEAGKAVDVSPCLSLMYNDGRTITDGPGIGQRGHRWSRFDGERYHPVALPPALAHYGPPESLVGKWALQVQVTP